jgi:ApaG protein
MSESTTRGVLIHAVSRYELERSAPQQGDYFFSYRVRIENLGADTVQLLSRLWIITDDSGSEQRVEGPGVVGETPTLRPGEAFEYQSFCPLRSSFGTMQGHYVMMVVATGERFEASIAPFSLAAPHAVN